MSSYKTEIIIIFWKIKKYFQKIQSTIRKIRTLGQLEDLTLFYDFQKK